MSELIKGHLKFPLFFWGRRVKPLAFALMLSMFALSAEMIYFRSVVFTFMDHRPGDVLGAFAFAGGTMLFLGWYLKSIDVLDQGLIIASAIWTSTFISLCLSPQQHVFDILLSGVLSVAATGSWVVEAENRRLGRD